MKRSTERILTTHVGSLARPDALVPILKARDRVQPYDRETYARLVRQAVARVGDPRRLEVSGGITLDSVPLLVQAGARVISVGRITHSAPSLDLSLEVTDVH